MRVVVTGATGFTGRRVAAHLVRDGHEVVCFVRASSRREALDGISVTFAVGDLGDARSLESALEGADALVNVASIGFGHGPGIVRAASVAGVERAVFFSTTAVFTSLAASSRRVRLAAEEAIRESALDWTILRPTMIYGAPGDRNVERLLRALRRVPVLPLPGGGRGLVQPVLVDDLAAAAVEVLSRDRTRRRCYSLPGGSPVTFRRFVSAAAAALGRRVLLVPVPAEVAVAAARLAPGSRVSGEQVRRLLEDKDFDDAAAREDFGYAPAAIEEGLRLEAERLGFVSR